MLIITLFFNFSRTLLPFKCQEIFFVAYLKANITIVVFVKNVGGPKRLKTTDRIIVSRRFGPLLPISLFNR